MQISFLHIADIHIDKVFSDIISCSKSLSQYSNAIETVYSKFIDLAIDKKVNFVLIAGDTFDSVEHDLHSKLLFINGLKKLADNGIYSYIICGNHDPIEQYKIYSSYYKFDEIYQKYIHITGVTTPQNIELYNYNNEVHIHSISFISENMKNPTNDLKNMAVDSSKFNIGLIHCDLEKSDSDYAPCSKQDLINLGYDYYALGHIHVPTEISENIIYSGTPQGRSRKDKEEHGCYYLEVNDNKITNKEFIPLDIVQIKDLELDCSDCENKKEVFDKISLNLADEKPTIYNIILKGISDAYKEMVDCDLVDDYESDYSQFGKIIASITNNLMPDISETDLKNDVGFIGFIANNLGTDFNEKLNKLYDDKDGIFSSILADLKISKELKNELKKKIESNREKIIKEAKREIDIFCKEVYQD